MGCACSPALVITRHHRRYRRWRRRMLAQEPLCRACKANGLTVAAEELHHEIPVGLLGALMDPANVIPLCRDSHEEEHIHP